MTKDEAIASLLSDAVKAAEDGKIDFGERLKLAAGVVRLLMAILVK